MSLHYFLVINTAPRAAFGVSSFMNSGQISIAGQISILIVNTSEFAAQGKVSPNYYFTILLVSIPNFEGKIDQCYEQLANVAINIWSKV